MYIYMSVDWNTFHDLRESLYEPPTSFIIKIYLVHGI